MPQYTRIGFCIRIEARVPNGEAISVQKNVIYNIACDPAIFSHADRFIAD